MKMQLTIITACLATMACSQSIKPPVNEEVVKTKQTSGESGVGKTDVVVVVAIGAENISNATKYQTSIHQLLSSISQKTSSNGGSLSVIASSSGAVSGVKVNGSQYGRQIQFELSPKDSIVGTLMAGCLKSTTILSDPHAPGTATICNEKVSIPSHSWTWSLEPMRETLMSSLREGSRKVYILIASNDALIGDAFLFQKVTAINSTKPVVHVIAPTQLGGDCTSQNAVATKLLSLSQSTAGIQGSFCGADWSSTISKISESI